MEFNELLEELKNSHEQLKEHIEEEDKLIKEECLLLKKLTKHLFPFATKKVINGEESLLLFVFPEDNKEWVSHEVYYTKKGDITYQVYDTDHYLGRVPNATIKNGFVYSSPIHFLKTVPFQYIYDFFIDRIDMISDDTVDLINKNKKREFFLKQLKDLD